MKSKIDWPNHLVSFVMVVLSILLAFQLEKCAEDGRENRLVDAHMREIVAETEFNHAQIGAVVKKIETDVQQLDTLLRLIDGGEDLVNINRLIFSLLDVRPPYIKKNAYNSFTTSGDIRFLEDFTKKSDVVTLYEYHKQAEAYGTLLMKNYEDGFWSHIRQELDLWRAQPQAIEAYNQRPFVNAIASYRYFMFGWLAVYRKHQERMERFLTVYGEA